MAESIFQVWNQKSAVIPGLTTIAADSISLPSFFSATYLLSFNNASKNKSFTLKINKRESGLRSQVFSKSGDVLNIVVEAIENGGNMELRISNNESFQINYTLARAKV
jgi:hypothetical protein